MRAVNGSLRMPVFAALATVTAAICLGRTFLTGSWFFPSVFAVVLVAVGCEVARRVSTSSTVVPLGGLVALLGYLLVRYGHTESYLHIVPTGATLDRLGELTSTGREDIARYAAPVGVSPGIEFLTVAGIGLVALVVDTLAVTWRRAALAGLPLLVLYTVPIAVAPDGVNWVAFAVAAVGFLALLLAESRERVSRWGRPMRYIVDRPNLRADVETAPLGQVGRRVGATALGLALVVPAVLPDLSTAGLGFGSGGFGTGGGGNRVSVVNPILDLGQNLRRPANRPVLSYRGEADYLRLVGLDEFTGGRWQPSDLEVSRDDNDVEDGLRGPPGLSRGVARDSRRYNIRVFEWDQTWLPLPYPATRVSIDGTWLYDPSTFNVFGENTSTRGIEYDVRSLDVAPTAEQLRAAPAALDSLRRYVRLPDDLPDQIESETLTVVGDLPTAYDRALAIQDWLRDPEEFTYSTEVSDTIGDANGSGAILGFLQTRAGYCVQFASTMAVMARLLDIPARVAIGFTPGVPDGEGRRTVRLHDLHAWPELYFAGTGWVRFEPTPSVRTGNPPSWAQADTADGSGTPGSTPAPTSNPNESAAPLSPLNRERADVLEQGGGGGVGAGPIRIPVVPLLMFLGAMVLLAVPASTRFVVRRRRWSSAHTPAQQARAAWADLQDTLVDFGYQWRPSDPPRLGTARLVGKRSLAGEAAQAAHRLAGATEQARYAPVMATAVGDLRGDVETVRAGLSGSAGRWGRWRARLLPRSTRAVSSALSERIADGLDALDAGVAAVTSRLSPRRG